MAKLVVASMSGELKDYTLGSESITLGREPENEIQLDGLEVSRRHCRIEPLPGGGYRLVDLGSKNGTFLNGRQVTAMALEFDDRLRLGDSRLVYVDDDVDPVEALARAKEDGTFWMPTSGEPSDLFDESEPEDSKDSTWRSKREQQRTGPHTRSSNRSYLKERLLRLGLLTQNIASAPDLSRLMDTILDEVLDFTGFERGLLLLGEEDGSSRLRPVLGRNMDHEHLGDAERSFSRGLVEEALRDKKITFRAGLSAGNNTLSIRESVISMGLESTLR